MQNFKRVLSIVLAFVMIFAFAACNSGETEEKETTTAVAKEKATINIATLQGPTGMGISKLADDANKGNAKNNYNITLTAAPEDIVSMVSSGEVDMAMCPLNLAATLYNKTDKNVKLLAVNTLGVLYIMENGNTINSIADLKGKTIYATGKGSTPEYILNYLLEKNGLEVGTDVTIEYKSEHSELATLAAAGSVSICMLPEPNVTVVKAQNKDMRIALDLTAEWEKVNGDESKLAMGCIIVNKDFLSKNKAAVEIFMDEYEASVEYVNKNAADAAKLIVEQQILPSEAIATNAIPNCNITFIAGLDMQKIAKANLQMLFDSNPQSVGKALPDDNFYYQS
ncbi:MAG: ABC transporter substrate-binding protein [Clostridia bacterium]|nr:ABC transporter substrate-binding protein [Clostridia bacterium]